MKPRRQRIKRSRRRAHSAVSSSSSPAFRRRAYTKRFPTFITLPNALPRWSRRSPPTPSAAPRSPKRKSILPAPVRSIAGVLLDANLPERITHNDTKFNNVLLDDKTGEAVCVIDLDTVMPGLALYDFGDMVRTTTSPAAEDEQDLSKVTMQFPMFEALVRGYLESAGAFLTPAERKLLAFSGKLITFEIGIRFLTDHLAGDTYFKIHREGHNLDRCRTQFKLVESIEQQEEKMNRLVESVAG